MEDKKLSNEEVAKTAATKDVEIKINSTTLTHDVDDYMEEYYLYDSMFYCDEKCFSCKHWLGYGCGAPNGHCNCESH